MEKYSTGGPPEIPQTLRRRLRYSDYSSFAGTSGILSVWVFVANGLYDPDFSGSGHQPLAFDQYMALYSAATVLSARITVDAVATTVPICFGVCVLPISSASFSSYSNFIEAGNCEYMLLDTDGGPSNRLNIATDIGKALAISDLVEEAAMASTVSSNPTQASLYFHVFCQDVNKTSTANAELNVTIDFDVVFHAPIKLAQS